MNAVLIGGLFGLSIVSGMLGLGVAFAAVPFLSFFMPDLVHQVQPLSLLLNGVTALFAVFGFAQGGFLDWRRAILLSIVTTLAAPVGAWVVGFVPQIYVWFIYFVSVAFLAYRLFRPVEARLEGTENFMLALILAVPISMLSGFLLLPTLILVGFDREESGGDQRLCCHPAVVLLTAAASGHGTMGYAHRSSRFASPAPSARSSGPKRPLCGCQACGLSSCSAC